MNYTKIYNDFIKSRNEMNKTRKIIGGNVHHIIPVCAGGLTVNENLIPLTFREHLFAHIVLYKKYKQDKNLKLATSMLFSVIKLLYLPRSNTNFEKILNLNLKTFEKKYISWVFQLGNNMKGENNPNYGNKWNNEQKEKASIRTKKWQKKHPNWNPMNNQIYIEKVRQSKLGIKNPNAKKYKVILNNGKEYIILPPVKINIKKISGIDYQQFNVRIDEKTRFSKTYNAYLIDLGKITRMP